MIVTAEMISLARKLGVSPMAIARHLDAMERSFLEGSGELGELRGLLHVDESHPNFRCEPPAAPPKEDA